MADPIGTTIVNLLARMATLENEVTMLTDRVAVLEDNTCTWDCRLEQIEEWQDEVDDKLDEEL